VRFIIFGAGAVGGVVGARLHQAGADVTLIARGAHFQAVREVGLTLEGPSERSVLEIPVVDGTGQIEWTRDHVVLLTAKSQDTAAAVASLAASAPAATPIVCLQNGVENERLALRAFANVYACVVMLPAVHLEPGIVRYYATPITGILDLGRYPRGVDALAGELADVLAGATFSSRAYGPIMRSKYAKLLRNLANAVQAICGPDADAGELAARAVQEGRNCLRAAGIEFETERDDATERLHELRLGRIAGAQRGGGSTWQSLVRGAGSVEADYLNGEVVLLGRLHGVPTPVNQTLRRLANRMARERLAPGWLSPQEVLAQLPGAVAEILPA
jgi:2-dehydropantoate 2-reductase